MRFFFEFVSCCGPACCSVAITPAAEEERLVPSLYAASVPVDSRRRQSRRSRSGSSGDWRPALNAISEDNVVVERGNHQAVVGESETITKKRKVTQSPRKVQGRNYGNDYYRRAPFGGAMAPAFSPTPFFF